MKYIPGLITGELRGSAGNFVASRNTYGAFIGPRIVPADPATSYQLDNRELFAAAQAEWNNTAPEAMLRWEQAAQNFPVMDSLGQKIVLTGQAFYIRMSMFRQIAGGVPEPIVPSYTNLDEPIRLENFYVNDSDVFEAYWDNGLPALCKVIFYGTPPLPAGRNYIKKSDYRIILIDDALEGATTVSLSDPWSSRFGHPTVVEGQLIGFKAVVLNPYWHPGDPQFHRIRAI